MWPPLGEAEPQPRASFEERGAAALGPVLDQDELVAVRGSVDALLPKHGVRGGYASIIHDAWRLSETLAELVPRLGRRACEASGEPTLVLFHDHVLEKAPHGEDMQWHQDFSYLPLDRAGGLTLWVALDDVTIENGCLYYLLGSHLGGERRAAWGMRGSDDPRMSLPPIEVSDENKGVAAETAAGSAIAHHTHLLHRSPRSRGRFARRTWALSFVVPDARWSPSHSPHPRSAIEPRAEGQALEPDLIRVTAG